MTATPSRATALALCKVMVLRPASGPTVMRYRTGFHINRLEFENALCVVLNRECRRSDFWMFTRPFTIFPIWDEILFLLAIRES